MKFSAVPVGACFSVRGKTHVKASAGSYLTAGYGAERKIAGNRNVQPAVCPRLRPLYELGRAKLV